MDERPDNERTGGERIESLHARGVARIWLNRPDKRNAFDERMITELDQAVAAATADPRVRCIVLAGRGSSFCAGGDLEWMRRARTFTAPQAHEDSLRLARMLQRIHDSPKPVIVRVHGACFAGGVGLAAASDIVVAASDARFSLSEVRLGLIPAVISPFVIAAISTRQARRYFRTAETFGADEARRIGLAHEVAPEAMLDDVVQRLVEQLLLVSPQACTEAGRLIRRLAGRPIDDAMMDETAAWIARLRASDDAQEGIAAFFEKRAPRWAIRDESGHPSGNRRT